MAPNDPTERETGASVEPPSQGSKLFLILTLVTFAVGLWATLANLVLSKGRLLPSNPGESLATANGLMSALAFAAVVYALILIKRGLGDQRHSLEILQRQQIEQTNLIARQLHALEADQERRRIQDQAMAEPLLNSKGGNSSANEKRIDFENAGATVMELSIKCETAGYLTELQPRLVLRSSDSGHLTIIGCDGQPEADVALALSYVTRLGKRGVKRYIVPSGNCALIEQPQSSAEPEA